MPPPKRKCASCRYFQSNQLSGNGWCTHPARQTSSDVRILVRKDELACRNSWGSDLWTSATGEQPAASDDSPDMSTQLPIPTQRRDDEITSVVHRDAPQRLDATPVVERDDIMVVEASLVPELRAADEDDDGNAGAHADQEHRARVLARGGNNSAIQDARQRMLARRTPQAPAGGDTSGPVSEQAEHEASESAAPDERTDSTLVSAGDADTAAIDSASTPVEAPLQPHAFRTRARADRSQAEPAATEDEAQSASAANDEDDRFNSIPAVDPSIDLPLRQAAGRDEPSLDAATAPERADGAQQVTVYDAVLERARAIRTAAGKETPTAEIPGHVRNDDIAREEKRARRRITTVPPTSRSARAAESVAPESRDAVQAAPSAPAADQRQLREEAAPAANRPRTFAELRRQQDDDHQVPDAPERAMPSKPRPTTQRMGISIAALKQREIQPEPAPDPEPRLDVSLAPDVGFRRVEEESTLASAETSRQDRPVRQVNVAPAEPETAVHYREEHTIAAVDDPDGYFPVEEPLAETRRGPFGRFRNPWRKDRDVYREQQIMATVRDALAETDGEWDDPFADVYTDADPVPQPPAEPAPVRPRVASTDDSDRHVVASNTAREDDTVTRHGAVAARRSERMGSVPAAEPPPHSAQPATPTRSHGLYRPVHEEVFRPREEDPAPDTQPPAGYSRRPGRDERGNGATVLRVRADEYDEGPEEPWFAPDEAPHRYAPRQDTRTWAQEPDGRREEPVRERIDDRFRYADAEPMDDYPPFDEFEPEPQVQPVEPAMSPAEARLWSFAPPVDLESLEGMSAFRGRLFGDAGGFAPNRGASEHRPGDDVVMDVPQRAEPAPVRERATMTQNQSPQHSPLRSSNYRGAAAPREPWYHAPTHEQNPRQVAQTPRQASGIERHQDVVERPVTYRETPRPTRAAHHVVADEVDAAATEFDLRDLLTGDNEPIVPSPTIAPDIARTCRTCRDFRPAENGDRGFCANNWAFTHRQMVNADDLP
ncbi:MAG: hypothetical protein WBA46_14885, partial [Thermomicrobiales bacterium]